MAVSSFPRPLPQLQLSPDRQQGGPAACYGVDCVSLNPRTSRHKRHTVSYQSREVIDHFCRAAPGPAGGRLTAGKNADQSLALLLDSPDFAQGMDQWAAEQPLNQGRPELAAFAAETLRRWHEYLPQGGGYRLGHG